MNEQAEVKRLILSILRWCEEECGRVATRIGDDGMYRDNLAVCDECYDKLPEGLWDQDYKYSERVRELMKIIEKW